MRFTKFMLPLGLALTAAACNQQPAADAPGAAAQATEIAWRHGDVDDALAEAKESGKPVILYWGAVWCPPCNQMKATLFKDPAFIAATQNFVPVYLDGDTPGAQRWGEHFGISGYPTVIVLRPDGTEVARLASSATSGKFAELLSVAAKRTESTDALLAKAEGDVKSLSTEDWHLLGNFDWQNDPKHFGDPTRAAKLVNTLAGAAPDPALKRRFTLLSLALNAQDGPDGKSVLTAAQQAQLVQALPAMLADPAEVAANRQELTYYAAPLIAALPDAAQRSDLGAKLVAALDGVFKDERLSLVDRLGTVNADIELAKGAGAVPPAVLDKVRKRVAWADSVAKDHYSRQSVMSDAAHYLLEAGDKAGAKALLVAELKKSEQPYYYMLDLASVAEEMGDKAEAIDWAHKAYDGAQGPATRVQWAIAWSSAVIRLAPADKAQVEASAAAVIDELGKNPGDYFQRTRVKVTAWGDKVRAWSAANGGSAVLARLQARMTDVCAKQGTEAATCGKWARA